MSLLLLLRIFLYALLSCRRSLGHSLSFLMVGACWNCLSHAFLLRRTHMYLGTTPTA
jgi:hypothetical protein